MFAIIEAERATNTELSIAAACRFFGVSTSGFYEWRHAQAHPCERRRTERVLCETIREIHRQSRGTYGAPRVHAELRLGLGVRVGRERVEHLMRTDGLQGVTRRRRRGTTRRDPKAVPNDDLVARQFRPDGPNQLWDADITEHPTHQGKVYCAVVIDAWNRQVVANPLLITSGPNWSSTRSTWCAGDKSPPPVRPCTTATMEPGQYTSWAFGQRLRHAGLLGSMGTAGDALDNAVAESFFASCKPSSSTATTGRPARSSHKRSSSGSRSSTTSTAGTRLSARSALCATQMRA
jgi:putative transposase